MPFELQIPGSGCMAEPAARLDISPVLSPYKSGLPWMELLYKLPSYDGQLLRPISIQSSTVAKDNIGSECCVMLAVP